MAAVGAACRARALPPSVPPPRGPKPDGRLGRATRTRRAESRERDDGEPERPPLPHALRAREDGDNRVRPHRAPGRPTPAASLPALGAPRPQRTPRTSTPA